LNSVLCSLLHIISSKCILFIYNCIFKLWLILLDKFVSIFLQTCAYSLCLLIHLCIQVYTLFILLTMYIYFCFIVMVCVVCVWLIQCMMTLCLLHKTLEHFIAFISHWFICDVVYILWKQKRDDNSQLYVQCEHFVTFS